MIGIGEISAIMAAIFWAIAAVLYKMGLRDVRALPAILIRTFFAMVFMFLLNLILNNADYTVPMMAFLFLSAGGILRLLLGGYLYFRGLEYASVSRIVPLIFTFPLFTMILSHLILGERIESIVAVGTVLIVAGIWILSIDDGISKSGKNPKRGIIFALFAAFCYAFSIIATRAGLYLVEPMWGAFISLPVPLMIMYMLYSMDKGPVAAFKFEKRSYTLLGIGGILGMGLGSYMFYVSLTNIGTTQATSLSSVTPLFSTILALIYLKEKVTIQLLLGTLIIIAGIWMVI